ncbi:SDR family oxidoreductase [Omnitrophica bacterium]|nr:SDR family oxidoreductase [Candidatus Omnitrophota bacterium]
MNKLLDQKTVLMTGGTSTLGRAMVRKMRQCGARVIFTYYQNQAGVEELGRRGAIPISLDLNSREGIDEAVKQVKAQTERLDVLIHNAATVRDKLIQHLSEEDWDAVLTVNLKAPYYLTKKLLPLLFKSAAGKIFFITSRTGLKGAYGASNYAASKAGLIALSKSLAQELGRKKILVNSVNPGLMKSRMTEKIPAAVIEQSLKENPLGEWSDPEEVADHMAWLCSDHTKQVTGQVFHIEGRKI